MPNCPVCGRDVPSGTQYCPTCGTNLQQSYGTQSTTSPTYSQTPSYSSTGGTGMPSPGQPRGSRRYIAIIAALLIGLVIGGVIGYSLPVAADYTSVTGTVILNSQLSNQFGGKPTLVWFNSTAFGNLTSAVLSNKYLINLPIGDTYFVSIQWSNATGTFRCVPSQSTFSSNNQNVAQDFSC